MSEKICENCWQFEEPEYSAEPGKCCDKIFDKPYKDTPACDDFDDRYPDER